MATARWPFQSDRPTIEVAVRLPGGQDRPCRLRADTGAGSRQSVFELACPRLLKGSTGLPASSFSGDFITATSVIRTSLDSISCAIPDTLTAQAGLALRLAFS